MLTCLMTVLGASCLKESAPAAMDAGGLLPPDITEQPPANDAGPVGPSTEIKPLLRSEFIFLRLGPLRKTEEVLAYDLATSLVRVLFDSSDVVDLVLAPDRQSFLGVNDPRSSGISPIFKVSLDGKQRRAIYALDAANTPELSFVVDGPVWSIDGTKVFYDYTIIGRPAAGGSFRNTKAAYFTVGTVPVAESQSDCETPGMVRPHPTDANRALLHQSKPCGMIGVGLVEYTVSPFAPVKLLTGDNDGPFEYLHDGSVIYEAKDGAVLRLDGSTGAKTMIYKPDSTHQVDELAVGPADEILVVLASIGVDKKDQWDIYRLFPETGMTTRLTTDGNSYHPKW
jgi:hypothetical protein